MQAAGRRSRFGAKVLQVPPVVLVFILMVGFFAISHPTFLTINNMVNTLRQGSILIVLCMGVAFVRIAGGIDLSVGAIMSLCGMVMAWILANGSVPIVVGLGAAVLVGFALGMLNGLLVSKVQMPSFIVTLGTQGIAYGISLGMNKGLSISGLPDSLDVLGNGAILGLPIPFCFALFTILLSLILLKLTPFGIYLYAIGGNEDALRLAGKPSWKYKALTYGYSGIMAGLAGIVITARTMAAQPTVGQGMEFEAFFAVVLGGVFAGKGGMTEILLGAFFILVLRNGLNIMGIPTYLQLAVIGVVLISGIIFSTTFGRRLRR
jgi:ribose transport system permease protein